MLMIRAFVFVLLGLTGVSAAWAKTATLPDESGATGTPFKDCTYDPSAALISINGTNYVTVECGSVSLFGGAGNDIAFSVPTILNVTGDMSLAGTDINIAGNPSQAIINVSGNFVGGNNGNTVAASLTVGGALSAAGGLTLTGDLTLGSGGSLTGNVSVSNELTIGNSVTVNGNITSGPLVIGLTTTIVGNIDSSGAISIGNASSITGTITGSGSFANEAEINGNVLIACSDLANETFTNTVVITGNVNSGCLATNSGTITGYLNAPAGSVYGTVGQACDFGNNAVDPCPSSPNAVSYFELVHDGAVITCAAEDVQIKACADPSCLSLAPISGTYTLTATAGATSYSDAGTFDGSGSAIASLPITTSGIYTLSLNASDTADSASRCNTFGVNDCTLAAADTGLTVLAPATAQAGVALQITVQAQTTDARGRCAAAADGLDTIGIAYTCINPASCLSDGTATDANANTVTITDAPTFNAVTVDFFKGEALVDVIYPDAGSIRFEANKILASGATARGKASDSTIVRPFAFVVSTEAAANISQFDPNYAAAPTYKMAGEPFPIAVTAVDALGNATPNYGNETPQQQPLLSTTPQFVLPVTGGSGSISLSQPFSFSGTGTGTFTSDVAFSDIGVIRLAVSHKNGAYLSTGNVTGTSAPLGRFYPAYFLVTEQVSGTFLNAQDDFTYIGQPLSFSTSFFPQLQFSPKNMNNQTINNYRDQLFHYSPDWSTRTYAHALTCDGKGPYTLAGFGTDSAQVKAGTNTDTTAEFVVGLPSDTGLFYVQDPAVESEPFASCAVLTLPAAALTDGDQVCAKSDAGGTCNGITLTAIQGTELLDGRLRLFPTPSSTSEEMQLEFAIEYYLTGGFVVNTRDHTTPYSSTWLEPVATRFQNFDSVDGLDASFLTAGTLGATSVNDGFINFSEPLLIGQAGNSERVGTFNWIVNLNDIGLPWLAYAWDEECSPLLEPEFNPCTVLQYGIYRGNDRIIYQRELGW